MESLASEDPPSGNDDGDVNGDYEVDFKTIDTLDNAFSALHTMFQKALGALDDKQFQKIKNACVNRADQADKRLSSSLQCASDGKHLIKTLGPYCNWMCIDFLETIAYAYKNDGLVKLIKSYKLVIFSKTLHEVWKFIPYYSTRDKYYTELTAIFKNEDPEDLTVEELNQRKPQPVKDIAINVAVIQRKSLLVSWLIPTVKVYQTFLSFLTIPQKSRKDSLVKFGGWISYLPQHVLQEEKQKEPCLPLHYWLVIIMGCC